MPRLMQRTRLITRFAMTLGLLSAPGCSLDVTTEGLAVFAIVSGDQQTVQTGAVAQPFTVRAYTASAQSIQDVRVKWTIASGGGSLSASSTTTDDTGATTVVYTAGTTPGTAAIVASAEGITVTFHVEVVAASNVRL